MPTNADDKDYTPNKVERRRDEVIRRMANTAPQPRVKPKSNRRGKKMTSGPGRVGRKPSPGKEA